MQEYSLAFSSCPNDTLVFYAMLHGKIDTLGYLFNPYINDVEDLNRRAFNEEFSITKLSFHAWLLLRDRYEILDAGAALGFGCGPLLVTSREGSKDLSRMKIAVPGEFTTACMLMKLWNPDIKNIESVRFDNIMPGIEQGKYDAGLIIHEGRFVYEDYGLEKIIDLGEWWESETGLPIPLGCIACSRKIDESKRRSIEKILHDSVVFGLENREQCMEFIKQHAQEMNELVIDEHISLYVNDFTLSLGEEGRRAVEKLESVARERGLIV